jgi:hypothetical protein
MDIEALEALRAFRHQIYTTMGCRRDALFEIMDAALTAPHITAPVYLSQEPQFQRTWGSLYDALQSGTLEGAACERLLRMYPLQDAPPSYAVDVTVWPRCDAETSPQRAFYHHSYRHSNGQPIVAGWAYQWVAHVHLQHTSWTAPLSVQRLQPLANVNQLACQQIHTILEQTRMPDTLPIFVFDAGYDPVQLSQGLHDVPVGSLVRLRAGRCFSTAPDPAQAATKGRPRRHGAKFACAEPSSWWSPSADYQEQTDSYGTVRVRRWDQLHAIPQNHAQRGSHGPRPLISGTIILLEVERLPKQTRLPEPMWLWWSGPTPPDLALIWRIYLARFTLEHTFRFFKQTLGWTTARMRHPEQADRWTWLLLLAYTQLRLARPLVSEHRLPWHKPLPANKLSPARVRRAFSHLLPALGSPVNVPKPCGRSPGRPSGHRSVPAPRFPAIQKSG